MVFYWIDLWDQSPKEIIILYHEQDISQRWSSVVKQRQFYVLHGLAEMGGQKTEKK